MNRDEKIKFLQSFHEAELTQKILIPLFESMGFEGVKYTHGVLENGKDIIYYTKDTFGKKEYTAVVVKAIDINKGEARKIVHQIREAFRRPFEDLSDNSERQIHRVLLMTSGKINEYARKYIFEEFENEFLGKFFSCIEFSDLILLLEKHMPETFWSEYDHFKNYFLTMKQKFEPVHDIAPLGLRERMSFDQTYVPLFLIENLSRIESGISLFMVPLEEGLFRETTSKVYEVLEAANKFEKMLVVGSPGSGKTTLLRYICLQLCKKNLSSVERKTTPIFFSLNELYQSRLPLREYLNAVLEHCNLPGAEKYIEKDLKKGKCIILMDGFDELATKERKDWVRDAVHKFTKTYPQNRLIIASRTEGYHGEFPKFAQMKVLEFDDDQIAMFIEKWFGDTQRAYHIMEKIESNDHIHRLAKSPLIMAIIAMIFEEDRKIPQRRVELYRRCIELLLSRWNRIKGIKNKFLTDKKEFVLRKLALRFQIDRRTVISKKELLKELKKYLPRVGLEGSQLYDFLDELCEINGILRQESLENYDFLHLSFQEYLAALEIEKTKNYDLLMDHLSDTWWEETTRLAAGINGDGTELISRILEYPQDGSYMNLFLAGKCIADTVGTDLTVRNRIVQQLEEILTKVFQPFLLEEVIQVLVEIGSNDIQAFLVSCLTHPDLLVREASITALVMLHAEEALTQLKKTARDDPEWRIRCHSMDALVRIDHDNIIPEIVQILLDDPDPRVREHSIKTLQILRATRAIPFLNRSLFSDSDYGVRVTAAKALNEIDGKKAMPVLSRAYKEENDPVVKEIISNILKSWEDQ